MCQSKADGGKRCLAHQSRSLATALVPRRGSLRGYYAATDAKHFAGPDAPGSTFTDPTIRRLNDVVALAARQRPEVLDGDDREHLAALGCPEETFRPGIRYLLVRTPGTVGIKHSGPLPGQTPVHVVRTKPGAPCSLVLDVQAQENTDIATVILGKHPDDETREIVYTAHPGLPVPVDLADTMGHREGQQVTLAEVRTVYGGDVWLNTRLGHD